MKKWKALLMSGVVALSLAAFVGCGGGNPDDTDKGKDGDAYGTLSIADEKVYITEDSAYTFAELNPVFSEPDKAETLTYTYDTKYIKIENQVVTPVKRENKVVNVRAKSDHFNVVFKVEVEYLRFTDSMYDCEGYPVSVREQTCKAVNENTTLFIGDSFMDDGFIGEYMETYSVGKEVLNAGMSSTTSYHWEATYKKIIGSTAPKNIVMHIGTNNFYDAHDMVEDTEDSLTRLFMFIHSSYPTSNIYWFNITQRVDKKYAPQVTETNEYMAEWCQKYDWITCVDTCSKVTTSYLRPAPDEVHPTLDGYKIFTDELEAAGCKIVAKP